MCDKIMSKTPFMFKYCPDKYITEAMRNEAVDNFLPILYFVPDWFVTSKMFKWLYYFVCKWKYTLLYTLKDSGNAVLNYDEIDVLDIDLINTSLDNDFDEDDTWYYYSCQTFCLGILNLKSTKNFNKI